MLDRSGGTILYKKILLAVDGSQNALRAAEEAVRIAGLSFGTYLDIVCVIDFNEAKKESLQGKTEEEIEFDRRKKIFAVEQLMRVNKADFNITFLTGDPAPQIISYAINQKVDLVIIGSRGLNRLQELMQGSVSQVVVKSVPCPVLLIK